MSRSHSSSVSLMWFRDDLRLRDNAALTYAASYGPVVCLFVEEENAGIRPVGAAAQWWRNRSILALKSELENHGAHLLIARGDPRDIIPAVAAQLHSRHDDVLVAWNRRYHAPFQEVDSSVKERLKEQGVEAQSFAGYLLTEPWLIRTGSGSPYKVFTPFAKSAQQTLINNPPEPLDVPDLTGAQIQVDHPTRIDPRELTQEPSWAGILAEHNTPGEEAAHLRFQRFLDGFSEGAGYAELNDVPAADATSGLSPHLRFGEISPAFVWAETARFADAAPHAAADAWAFLRQLLWRDFAWHRLAHLPHLATENVRNQFDRFPWAWSGKAARGRRQAFSRTRTWNLTAMRANISRSFPHGSKDARAFRLSTPACANSGPPAPCTTV